MVISMVLITIYFCECHLTFHGEIDFSSRIVAADSGSTSRACIVMYAICDLCVNCGCKKKDVFVHEFCTQMFL